MKNLSYKARPITLFQCALVCSSMAAGVAAQAQNPRSPPNPQNNPSLADLINAYRAAPGSCEGGRAAPAPPLAPEPALARARVETGMFLEQALERAGYPVARAEAIYAEGPPDERAAMAAIERRYCRTLLSTQFTAVGAGHTGNSWLIVLAQPAPPSPVLQLPQWQVAGQAILGAVNAARSMPRSCGARQFAPAPALAWNGALADAALAHSGDMATQRYFSHQGKDGRVVGERALQAGYRWRRIGENIASGQDSANEAVTGWLSSPGHCANLMSRDFTEMGAAYAISTSRDVPRVYWTQVFGTPR